MRQISKLNAELRVNLVKYDQDKTTVETQICADKIRRKSKSPDSKQKSCYVRPASFWILKICFCHLANSFEKLQNQQIKKLRKRPNV